MRQNAVETYHRVKNHLQIVAALVDIHAGEKEEGMSPDAVQKLGLHIRTLAQIHDLLTKASQRSEDTNRISAQETLSTLIPMIQATVIQRTVHFLGSEMALPTRMSTSLALVVNELVSNAIKYSQGHIEVELTRVGDQARLEISDDGPGFPDDFAPQKLRSVGLGLVESLTRGDLHGKVRYENRAEGGGCVVITFPVPE